MRVLNWGLIACLSLWFGCGMVQAVEYFQNLQSWIVSLPDETQIAPEHRIRIGEALLRRASSLASVKKVEIRSVDHKEFQLDFSAPRRSAEVIQKALTHPGGFSVRSRGPLFKARGACDPLNPEVIRPTKVEDARMGFDDSGSPVVSVTFNVHDAEVLRNFTRDKKGEEIAACLGQRILAVAKIESELGSYMTVPGFSSPEDALVVAAIIFGGPIPDGMTANRRDAA